VRFFSRFEIYYVVSNSVIKIFATFNVKRENRYYMSGQNQSNEKPSWLGELQQKSWEPEILLSGIVLYGMFQAPGLLDNFLAFAKLNLFGNFNDLDNFIALLKIALYWLILGLILHLVSRGIWVGMVGLSFTFPNGINKEKLKLSPRFQKNADKIPPIEQIIINLEKLCSSLFSISFMMFMMVIGGYLFLLITLILPIVSFLIYKGPQNIDSTGQYLIQIYAIFILGIGVLGLIDFITLGLLKRIKWLSIIYYPIHRLISALSLARFYRPIYFTLISNYNKWKIGLSFLFFVIMSFIMLTIVAGRSSFPGEAWTRITIWSNAQKVSSYSGYYDDQNKDFHSVNAQIQSDIISENTIRLFSVLKISLEDSLKKNCNYDSLISLDTAGYYVELQCASMFHQVMLDNKKVEDLKWYFHYKQKTNQRGILTYIDITDLPKGMHSIRLKGPDNMYSYSFAEIPFYREIIPRGYQASPSENPKEGPESYLKLKPILPK